MLTIIGYIGAGLAVGFLLAWLLQQLRLSKKLEAVTIENVKLKKDIEVDTERMRWLEITQDRLKESFKLLSSDLLSANAAQFLSQAKEKLSEVLELQKKDWGLQKEEMKGLVDPLSKNLSELDQQIQQIEQKREGAYRALIQQVSQLSASHQELQKTTLGLTHALKSTSVRGRWGEVQLRRIVEMAGMMNHVDFSEQISVEEGRPDMVVHLPNQGIIPVDSKTPMNAYLEAQEIRDEESRQKKLNEHARAMRQHMKALSQKAYWAQFQRAPEFVVMVVPYDSGLTAAFERDGQLLEDAFSNKVLIVSPVSLLALLKVIAYGWLQLQLAENAQKIADQGKELYSRFVTFSGHLSDMGKRLDLTVQAYNRSVGSMESRIMPSIVRLKEMGAGTESISEIPRIDSQSRDVSQSADEEVKQKKE